MRKGLSLYAFRPSVIYPQTMDLRGLNQDMGYDPFGGPDPWVSRWWICRETPFMACNGLYAIMHLYATCGVRYRCCTVWRGPKGSPIGSPDGPSEGSPYDQSEGLQIRRIGVPDGLGGTEVHGTTMDTPSHCIS